MSDQPLKPVLQKPPGYIDPSSTTPQPLPRSAVRRRVPPPPLYTKKKRKSCCCQCCCYLTVFFIFLIFASLIAGLFFYLWYDPKLPEFHVGSFRVQQFNVTIKPDGSFLTSRTAARIEMKNPNGKLKLYYGDINVDVGFGQGDDMIDGGSTKIQGFRQGVKNTTSLKLQTQVKNQIVDDSIAKRLNGKFKSKELVVTVMANTKVGFGVGGRRIGMLRINMNCGGISLKKMDSTMPKCKVNALKWININ